MSKNSFLRIAIPLTIVLFSGITQAANAQNLRIFTEENPPLNFTDADGRPTGLVTELVRDLQQRTGNNDPINVVPWARGLANLDGPQPSLLFSMARTAEREHRYQWIGPVYQNTYNLYVLSSSNLFMQDINQAKTLRAIGVYRDDIRERLLLAMNFGNLNRQADPASVLKLLLAGQIDAMASSPTVINSLLAQAGRHPDEIRKLVNFGSANLYIAASLATPPAVVADWNRALLAMRSDGSLKRLFAAYGLLENYPEAVVPLKP